MGIVEAGIVWFISSWIVFMPLASRGIQTQAEAGDIIEGSEPSAPVSVDISRKAIVAILAGAVITLLVWLAIVSGLFQTLYDLIDYTK
jgi:predicted secreted protein